MATATARIAFAGGGLILPAHTPYDRQMLVEHVLGCTRSKQHVRIHVDHTTWLIERADQQRPVVCSGCARRIDDGVCRRRRRSAVHCVACALGRPLLTIGLLSRLPAAALLRDVQARSAYGGQWIPWMRWPQATPAEIIDDMRLQRRFAPVLMWHCAEIRLPPPRRDRGTPAKTRLSRLQAAAPRLPPATLSRRHTPT